MVKAYPSIGRLSTNACNEYSYTQAKISNVLIAEEVQQVRAARSAFTNYLPTRCVRLIA